MQTSLWQRQTLASDFCFALEIERLMLKLLVWWKGLVWGTKLGIRICYPPLEVKGKKVFGTPTQKCKCFVCANGVMRCTWVNARIFLREGNLKV